MAAYNMNPLFDNVMKQKRLDNNVFSFYFDTVEGAQNSKLVLGGVDNNLFTGPVNYFKVIDKYYWTVKAKKILINDQEVPGVCNYGCKVVADTGTSLITGPSDDLNIFLDHLGVDENCGNLNKLPRIR